METISGNYHLFSEGITTTNKTIELESNGFLQGTGNGVSTIHSTANPIIRVLNNAHQFGRNALLGNIIIEGDNSTISQIAIELNDVSRCNISNLLIKDVEVGIRVRVNTGNSSESNLIEHVQMENVNKGLQFFNNGSGNFGSTHIEGVSISLNDQENLVGIEVEKGCILTMPQIFASVTSTKNCVGMYVDGVVSGEFIQFSHTKDSANYGGGGVLLGEHASVGDQYGHFYVSGQHLTAPLSNPYNVTNYIVQNNSEGYAATVEDSENATNVGNLLGNINDGDHATIMQSGWITVAIDQPIDSGQIFIYGHNPLTLENSTIQVYVSDNNENWTMTNEVELEPSTTPFWIDGGFSENPFSYVKIQTTGIYSEVCIDSIRVEYQAAEE
jgi:hypothetical protein